MTTAVMDASVLDQRIASLENEAKELDSNLRAKYAELSGAYQEKAAAYAQFGGSAPSAPMPVAVPRKNAVSVRKKPGKRSRVSPVQRNYDNKVSLRQTIWNILSRGKAQKVSEIKDIIEKEKQWVSNSGDINPQIQQHLYGLKKEGKIERDAKEHTYSIKKGETL